MMTPTGAAQARRAVALLQPCHDDDSDKEDMLVVMVAMVASLLSVAAMVLVIAMMIKLAVLMALDMPVVLKCEG